MVKYDVDLVVIEGMGRTLHTNFHAKMKCECLKLAVIKNRWLALRLGGDMYAVICKYEQPPPDSEICQEDLKVEVENDCPSKCMGHATKLCKCDNPSDRNTNKIPV
jgi:hypothetical protein